MDSQGNTGNIFGNKSVRVKILKEIPKRKWL